MATGSGTGIQIASMVISIVMAGIAGLSASLVLRSDKRRRRLEMQKEYNALSIRREEFWRWLVLKYSAVFYLVEVHYASLNLSKLLRECGFPPDVPSPPLDLLLRGGRDLQLWIGENLSGLSDSQHQLWRLAHSVSMIPIPAAGSFDAKSGSQLDREVRGFTDALISLANFWDAWVPVMSMVYLRSRYKKDRDELIMLSWLEKIPYCEEERRPELLKLTREIDRMGKSPSKPCKSFSSLARLTFWNIRKLW